MQVQRLLQQPNYLFPRALLNEEACCDDQKLLMWVIVIMQSCNTSEMGVIPLKGYIFSLHCFITEIVSLKHFPVITFKPWYIKNLNGTLMHDFSSSLLRMTTTGNQTTDVRILSPMSYPLDHVPPLYFLQFLSISDNIWCSVIVYC